MLFNSAVYIFLFLPLVVVVYYALIRYRLSEAAKAWLVLVSLFFYGYWNESYLLLIISSMLVNFALGSALHRGKKINMHDNRFGRKAIMISGIAFNLSLLGYFKYADFFIHNINDVLKLEFPLLEIALPLAISFFTFQQIAYLVDSYQTDTQEYDFLNYCLFVTFFPQLVAGPIVHHREMMPQFMRKRNLLINWSNISMGIFIFSVGLFKKVFIADSFAVWVKAGFDTDKALSAIEAWGASLSYTFQLYYDFSAYTDMAIGAALLLNIRLPINFNSPYKASSIQDFWRRWHITLSRWLRDYVYIPLGGNRKGSVRVCLNLFITFLLGGLWHGASWMFVVWGGMHGVALIMSRLWSRSGRKMHAFYGWMLTFMFVNISWVFFRAESFSDAERILEGMLGMNGFSNAVSIFPVEMLIFIVFFGLIAFLAPNTVQLIRFVSYEGKLVFRPNLMMAVGAGVLAATAISWMLMSTGTEFLYFNF